MAIEKRFIHFKKFSDFNSKKLSANEANTQYTVGVSGAIQNGEPDILYQSYVWIKDTKQQWTHGQLYDGTDSLVTESTISEWGFTKNAGTYSKPSDGIPNSDLSSDVRNALRYAEMYQGTVTSVKINGETKGSNGGVVDLGNVGTYSKPSTGIPKSDLASDVQTSLGKADNAVQKGMVGTLNIIEVEGVYDGDYVYALPTAAAKNVNEDYDDIILSRGSVKTINGESIVGSGNIEISSGTITGVSANGTSIATSGVANIPAASTSAYGVTKLNSSTSSTSTTEAATPSAVKSAYDLANSYKGTVTGVKINGSTKSPSSGTVDIGNVATTVKIDNVSKTPSSGTVDLGYVHKQLSSTTSSSMVIRPNMYYRNTSTSLTSLMITLFKEDVNGILNEYFVEFTTSLSGTTVSLPSGIKWMNGVTPTFEASTTYQISIVNNLGTWVKFK